MRVVVAMVARDPHDCVVCKWTSWSCSVVCWCEAYGIGRSSADSSSAVSHREVSDYGVTHHICTRTGPPVDVRIQQGSGGCSISANVYICVRVDLMCVLVSVDDGARGGGDGGAGPARLRRP